MDESGFGAQIAIGVLALVLIISVSIFVYSVEDVYDKLVYAKQGNNDRISKRVQTDVVIENGWWDQRVDNLRVLVRNSGSTVLNISEVNLLVDNWGVIRKENIASKSVDGIGTDNTKIWAPEENLVILTENIFPTRPERVKIVTEYGISDYFTNISEV